MLNAVDEKPKGAGRPFVLIWRWELKVLIDGKMEGKKKEEDIHRGDVVSLRSLQHFDD